MAFVGLFDDSKSEDDSEDDGSCPGCSFVMLCFEDSDCNSDVNSSFSAVGSSWRKLPGSLSCSNVSVVPGEVARCFPFSWERVNCLV